MAEQRGGKPIIQARVVRTERLTPTMLRVVFGGEDVASFRHNGFTDCYVKVLFPVPGVRYPEPFDLDTVKASLPREQWPRMRTYTLRHHDAEAGEIALDILVHGDEGLGGPWALRVRPGDEVLLRGPGGAYAPRSDVDHHLLVGDESALPAIAATMEALPADSIATVRLLVENIAEHQPLATKGAVDLRWLHRADGADLVREVRGLTLGDGTVQAFVHGEAAMVRELRGHLLRERGLDRGLLSISGYWRKGRTDEAWRQEKKAFMA
ncbi:siderophore-interacting protein [Saccharomonospora xinjiangensis]|uniref:siderophore-interacting protein n=1 Tax=Saccharomonospora xinjiangensis TaxID=75294 RepID=UPI00107045A1|nr:siderophore-interacting protein [Saccharomonospora xinjiangensis]QBQ59828.1 Vibriobactin utilization protein ViuB [Saccharomonospora xinjiangensis]